MTLIAPYRMHAQCHACGVSVPVNVQYRLAPTSLGMGVEPFVDDADVVAVNLWAASHRGPFGPVMKR